MVEIRLLISLMPKRKENKMKEMKEKLKKKRQGFFADFKKFITRGNVLDMAVGVIVGGAFTAIINALSNNILKPIINWLLAVIMGKDSLSEIYTFMTKAYTVDEAGVETLDLANSIYIDWGAFINAVINFILIALTLFIIVRIINKVRDRVEAKERAAAAEKKAKADAEAKAKIEAEKAAVEAMYANIARQTELLEKIAGK